MGTGGFATKNASVGAYNNTYIHIIIGIFMILSGVNFSMYYSIFQGKRKEIIKDEELKLYFGIIFVAVIAIGINLYGTVYSNLGFAFRDSFFK